MKKILVALVALCFTAPSFAQFSSEGFSLEETTFYYGTRVGLNLSGLSGNYYGTGNPNYMPGGTKAGINLALIAGFRVSQDIPLFLESGAYYSTRGAKKGKNVASFSYVELPVLLKYGVQVTDGVALMPFFGPYFSFNLAGKFQYPLDPKDPASKVERYRISKDYKIVDMGFKLGCGAEWNMLYLELGYQFGAYNMARHKEYGQAARTSNLFANFGVTF
ncbi:MAG: outer membrane beta-barrel protein [Bacteroidaceae bacterium]|nr:outer membrane beta-barrel protein [Bacteroidaceae bacterium]